MTNDPEVPGSARLARMHPRNCGQLTGHLGRLLPFICIAQFGATRADVHTRHSDATPGLFAIGAGTQDGSPGVAIHLGLIVPLALCCERSVRTAFAEAPTLLDNPRYATMSDQRSATKALLNDAFPGDFLITARQSLRGFYALEPTDRLFERLHESFEHVTEVVDDPADGVRVTASAPFRWRSYGDLMAWFHGARGTSRFGAWPALTPMLVLGNTAAMPKFFNEQVVRSSMTEPQEDPPKWFVVRRGLPNADVGIRLEMDSFGWATLHLRLDTATATIRLSAVYDPFDDLVAWGQAVDAAEVPVQMVIDEESQETVLTTLRTEDPQRVLFRVSRKYSNEIALEGIVERATLAAMLRAEILRFFRAEFDPQHWDEPHDEELPDGQLPIKDRVLRHTWFEVRG